MITPPSFTSPSHHNTTLFCIFKYVCSQDFLWYLKYTVTRLHNADGKSLAALKLCNQVQQETFSSQIPYIIYTLLFRYLYLRNTDSQCQTQGCGGLLLAALVHSGMNASQSETRKD